MDKQQLQEVKVRYNSMDWEGFRDDYNGGRDLLQVEIDIYDDVVLKDTPMLIAEVERLREALELAFEYVPAHKKCHEKIRQALEGLDEQSGS